MDFLKGKKLLQMEKDLVSAEVALKKKVLILYYFTAAESEACRAFDNRLREVYQEAVTRKAELAIIIVSADPDPQTFQDSLRSNYHDFYAIPYDDELQHILMFNYGITSTPTLIVVRKNGTLVTREGKKDIEKIGKNVLVTWAE